MGSALAAVTRAIQFLGAGPLADALAALDKVVSAAGSALTAADQSIAILAGTIRATGNFVGVAHDATGDTGAVDLGVYGAKRGLHITGAPAGDTQYTFSSNPPASFAYLEIVNDQSAPAILLFQGLWIPPGNITRFVFVDGQWRYAAGSGQAFVIQVEVTSQLTATSVATDLVKVPGEFQTRDVIERSKQEPVGGTATTNVEAAAPEDLLADNAVGAAGTFVQDTGSALLAGGIFDSVTDYTITQNDTVSAPLSVPAITSYTITLVDCR